MASLKITHSFTMSPEDLKAQLDAFATEISSKYQLKCQWQSTNCLSFKRSGVSGEIEIGDTEITLTMKLSMMMGVFKGTIEKDIRKFLLEHVQ